MELRIGIDATNIREGGGLHHLRDVLSNFNRSSLNIKDVLIWTNNSIISELPKFDWIRIVDVNDQTNSCIGLLKWQFFILNKELQKNDCDVLFVPGGTYLGRFKPFVVMAQNLLPFDKTERKKYRFSKQYFRLIMLEYLQKYTFNNSNGIIFLSDFSASKISGTNIKVESKTIYHGIDKSFFNFNRENRDFKNDCSNPIKLLYVSTINYYKNQINVVKAFEDLVDKGYKIDLTLIGTAYDPALKELEKYISGLNGIKNNLRYIGNVEHQLLIDYYNNADIFIFASSCETFGMILLEAMASGLPIACSNMTSMPEILEENGEYFDPNDPKSISMAVNRILLNNKKMNYSKMAFQRAKEFSWEKCSNETFKFLESRVYTKRLDIK